MNLDRMIERCRAEQWSVGDLDWDTPTPAMSEGDEANIVQFFTDMAGIERLAGALFNAQENATDDPVLKEIFGWCVVDEVRHSHAAQMLADHYDVRKLRAYQLTGRRMREAFKRIQLVSPKRKVARRPFVAFMLRMQALYNSPTLGPFVGRAVARILGIDPRYIAVLYTEAEGRRVQRTSLEDLALEALAAKHAV